GNKYGPAFYHYVADYLGNNRAVVRASDGAFVQVTHYYPWGSVYGDMGTGASVQPYKYGDKELDLTAGVARYDYAARAYFAAIPRFDRPDALAGKYPHISPYAFCANNPVNVTDPTGNILEFGNATDEDMDYIVSKLHNIVKNGIEFSYDSNHRIEIKSGEENIDKLAPKSVAGIMLEIITCDIETKIGIANDSEVLIGEIATERIDLHDIDKVNQDGLTPEGAFGHEVYENYMKAKYKHDNNTSTVPNKDINNMHIQATNYENKITGVITSPKRPDSPEKGIMTVERAYDKPIILRFDPLTNNLIK
ncbi:MAG: hypothetical protein K2K05_08695, partial [Muribaculaceae bacterium]|nr:hypothetical protein [Muribaculaceae bacterium]